MEIEILSENNRAEWDDFCLKSPSAWFRHTSAWSDYSRCCRFDSNSVVRSFMVKQGKAILAIVPLMSEYDYACPSKNCFALYGDYTPVPAFNPECEVSPKSILGAIDDQLRIVAKQDNVSSGRFFIDPLIEADYFRDFVWFNKMAGGGGGMLPCPPSILWT